MNDPLNTACCKGHICFINNDRKFESAVTFSLMVKKKQNCLHCQNLPVTVFHKSPNELKFESEAYRKKICPIPKYRKLKEENDQLT